MKPFFAAYVASSEAPAVTTTHFVMCGPLIGTRVLCSSFGLLQMSRLRCCQKYSRTARIYFVETERWSRHRCHALEVGVIRDEKMRSPAICIIGNRFPVICPPADRISSALHAARSANRSSGDAIENVFHPARGIRSAVGFIVVTDAIFNSWLQPLAQSCSRLVHLRF